MGKIPGVVINPTGGTAGSGSSINIRGYTTITGNTQPLWVVDGVPFSSATNDAGGFTSGGTAASTSRFLDLDPNAIESINVLKGLAATVLYGDQGRNGVILVNTKAGSGKKREPEIMFQQTFSMQEIASLPDVQSNYGSGFQQLTNPTQFFSNWGANYREIDSLGHPYQWNQQADRLPAFAKDVMFKRIPFRKSLFLNDFFRTGAISNTSLSVAGGTDKFSVTATVGYTTEEGYAPGNELKKINGSVGFSGAISDKMSFRSSVMYSQSSMRTPPLNGATGGGAAFNNIPSLYANFLYSPPNYNMNDLDLFPMEVPGNHLMMWYRPGGDIPNARWIAAYAQETDVTNRIFTSNTITYDFTDNMALSYRVGYDAYTQQQTRAINKGISPTYAVPNLGVFQTQTINNTIWNHDFIFSYNRDITTDIHMAARAGVNARNDYYTRDGIYSQDQVVFGLLRHSNFTTSSSRSAGFDGRIFYRTEEQQRYGVYADFQFDYKNYLFVNVAARKDWTSTLEDGHNSPFYPSISSSFVLTDAFSSLKSDAISFVKVRAGYGTSAGLGNVYGTRTVVASNARGYLDASGTYSTHTISNTLGNRILDPELFGELELGFEAKFLKERIGIDFTWFNRTTTDLITNTQIDPATGYTNTQLNLGALDNKGVEIGLTATPLKLGAFQWDLTWNFTHVIPLVVTLGQGVDRLPLAGFTDLGNFAVPNKPMNLIMGSVIARSPSGEKIVQADGFHEVSPLIGELGNPNPDYVTSLINTFSWKGISLQVQIDYRKGGKMYGSTPSALLARGVLAPESVLNRDLAFITPGVKRIDQDGDGVANGPADGFVPNDILATAADYGFNLQFFARNDNAMYDASNIRMREISLSYQFPKSILSKTPIKSASVTLNGNNLWHVAFGTPSYVNWDPEVASLGVNQGAGFDYLTGPTMKRYGAVLRLTF
jgi:TonB-linked SusC/RagA family outer membrane protein